MRLLISILILVLISSCTGTEKPKTEEIVSDTSSIKTPADETQAMVQRLNQLVVNGNPQELYHWNGKLAALYKSKIPEMQGGRKMQLWFKYCEETLNSGDTQTCIDEIKNFITEQGKTVESFLQKENLPIVELLGLAYLRQGENENCQLNHNEYACILPMREEAFHTLRSGSENATEIYSILLKKFPNEQYKWLLNLAYMTLGEYPEGVPKEYYIAYPNWDIETKEFPAFKEVSIGLGVAENGLSGGVCIDDFDKDGHLDIFATSYGMTDQVKLFMGNGSGFDDKTMDSGLKGIVSGLNCNHADYDNDGDRDILVLRGAWLGKGGNHPNSLLRNNGDGTFSDVTKSAGLLSFHPTQTASWADVDKDGFLDLFIGNETRSDGAHSCELYMNQKDGTFKEESAARGLDGIQEFVKGVSFGDIDNDRWPDLYISILGGKNRLYKNSNGTFEDIGQKAGVQSPKFSFPCWFWDINNDGYQDIFVSGYDTRNMRGLAEDYAKELQGKRVSSSKPRIYINQMDGTFSQKTIEYDLNKTMYSMGANFGDLDNDGWLDFYVGTGAPDFSTVVPNRMFRNNEGKRFDEVTSAGRFGHIQKGHGISFADLDCDGDQDIYAVMGGAYEGDVFTNVLYENPIENNHWVVIELEGVKTNRDAIGTSMTLKLSDGRSIFYTVNTGGSFGSNSLQAEIGIGSALKIEQLTIHWQNSEDQVFENVIPDKKYKAIEGEEKLRELPYDSFKLTAGGHAHEHQH